MPRYIVKLSEGDQSWYLDYSSMVDAPTSYGTDLVSFRESYIDYYGKSSIRELDERLERVEQTGTSSRIHESVEDQLSFNRAGKDETCLTIQQIIDYYCKYPKDCSEEEWNSYQENLPMGKKWEEDDD